MFKIQLVKLIDQPLQSQHHSTVGFSAECVTLSGSQTPPLPNSNA